MIEVNFFIKGIIIGILTSAPVGPIALLCIQRTVTASRLLGFTTGLGAATADTFYAALAAFALNYISDFVLQHLMWFRFVGSGFLFFFGVWFFLKLPERKMRTCDASSYITTFCTSFGFTLTNPITIFAFAALFTAFGIEGPDSGVAGVKVYEVSDSLLVAGVFLGANIWWLTLALLSGRFREWFSHPNFTLLNRILGVIFLFFGVLVVATLVRWH